MYSTRIQLGGVGRQIVHLDIALQGGHVVRNHAAAVPGQAVPDQQHRPVDLFPEMLYEIPDFLFPHGSLVQAEVELPQRDPRGKREVVPVELMLQDRRDAARGPSSHSMRTLTQPALVYKDDDPALFLGFFLRAGQRFSFQSRMAASFRSRARPTGR